MRPPTAPHPRGLRRTSREQTEALALHLLVGACIQARRDENLPVGVIVGSTYPEALGWLRAVARDDAAHHRATAAGCMSRAARARRDTRAAAATITSHPDGSVTLDDPYGALPYVHDDGQV